MQNQIRTAAAPAQITADIADHVADLIGTDLTESQMRATLSRTHLTEVERRIVLREVLAARAFVDSHEARVRAGWIDADRGGVA